MHFTLPGRSRVLGVILTAVVLVTAGCADDEPERRLTKKPAAAPEWFNPQPSSATATITGPATTPTDGTSSAPNTDPAAEPTTQSVTVRTDPRDNGAPVDPCTILSSSDLPDSIRPSHDIAFTDVPRKPDSAFQAACSLIFSADALDPNQTPADTDFVAVFVAAGAEPSMSADPGQHTNSDAAIWAGRSGARKYINKDGLTSCDGYVPVGPAGGVASVSVVNTLEPSLSPCTVMNSLMTLLVERVP